MTLAPSRARRLLAIVGVLWLAVCSLAAQQTPAPITVLKIAAGPSGRDERGTFVLTDERSVFNRTDDREVLVLFQWAGTAGAHKLVAQWRSPDGSLTSNSAIDYVAREARFGAFWTLPLTPSTPQGLWSIEATVDGLPAGRFTFEVTDRPVPSAVTRRPLTEAELFARLNPVFVVLERLSSGGQAMNAAAGFVNGGLLHTALSAIDGAAHVRAHVGPQGPAPVTSLLAWHRGQDWAVSTVAGAPGAALPIAAADGIRVGDRCYSMEGGVTSGRVLTVGTITGLRPAPESFIAAFPGAEAMPGAPVVNEFGELIGIVGGSGVPGATRPIDMIRFRAEIRGIPLTPWALVQVPAQARAVPIADLWARGEVLAALHGDDHIVEAGFTRAVSKSDRRGAFEARDDFAMRDKSFTAFVNWSPRERLRGQAVWRVFDMQGRTVLTSKPQKADFRKGARSTSFWEVPMLSAPGIYRVELSLDTSPMWRGFVRITP